MRSTILFVNGRSVQYSIEQQEDRYLLNPRHESNSLTGSPRLCAYLKGGGWVVEGCDSRNLFKQVVEEITIRFHLAMPDAVLA